MVKEVIRDKNYFDNKYFVEGFVWEELKDFLYYFPFDVEYMVEVSPVAGGLYVYLRGINPDNFYKIYTENFDVKKTLGVVTDNFLYSSIEASKDWQSAFDWVRKLQSCSTGVALVGKELEECRLMGSAMYGNSEVDEVLETLSESVDMSRASSMYIDYLKRAASKRIRSLKQERVKLKEENKRLSQQVEAYKKMLE